MVVMVIIFPVWLVVDFMMMVTMVIYYIGYGSAYNGVT